jgi:ABC-type transport system substrate-binding protein
MTADKSLERKIARLTEGMPEDSAAFFRSQLSRRSVLGGAAGLAGASLLGAMSASAAPSQGTRRAGSSAQDDAAPPEDQVWRIASDPTIARALDFYEEVYGRAAGADLYTTSLVQINKEFEIIPNGATEWSGSEDGKTWTFTLRDDLMWSDGNPVTAADYVKTFQYSADPEHAWDFTWFWLPDLVNYAEAVAGEVPVEEIGVKAGASEFEIVFTTINAAPYLPAKLLYSQTLSKAALETHGPLYNTNPDTAVSCGPFILEEWVRDQYITHKRNEAYTGPAVVPIQKVIGKFAAPSALFTMYEAGEIDYMEGPAPAELLIMEGDPEKASEVYQGVGDFACLYFFFDVNTAPFDDKLVRQAFSHVLDRDAVEAQILGNQANPAPAYLAPGFPASNFEGLADIQAFDPDLGKQLLAEAGYPDGEGFPDLVLSVRGGGSPIEVATTQAYGAMLSEHLGINVELQTVDRQSFYDQMNAKPTEILFGWVSYGMDYVDPSNMLGVWKTGGRHSWSNPEFDTKLDEGTAFLGEEADRIALFQEAERILVEDVPAVFAYYNTPIQLIKPYIKGDALVADSNGITAVHWPGFSCFSTVWEELYFGSDAPAGRE